MPGPGENSNQPSVDETTRKWIENCFLWLINSFGKENIKNRKVLTPVATDFPILYNGDHQSAFDTLKIVAAHMELNAGDIILHIYKEGEEEIDAGGFFGHRIFMQQVKGEKYSGGLYLGKDEDGKYIVALEEKKLKDPVGIVATLAHELSHIKLLGEDRMEINDEHLTDMTTIVFGLGVFNANMAFREFKGFNKYGWSRSGYLSQMQWGYALALFAHIREEEDPEWSRFLSTNVKADFKKSTGFIQNNPEKIFGQNDAISGSRQKSKVVNKTQAARSSKNFDELISLYKEQLTENSNNKSLYNNIGYALLQQKKYSEAVTYFNEAIRIAPRWDFPYNNRGYCKLQLGDIKGAHNDIAKACDMNPFNSFAWRNMGAYYLTINEFQKALENFEEAEKIDDRTELINFYLGKAHEKLGNLETAQQYLDRSAELNEYIDIPGE